MRWPFFRAVIPVKAKARAYYNQKEYSLAEPYLEKLLQKNSEDEWALDVMSRLYSNTGRHSECLELTIKLYKIRRNEAHQKRILHACRVLADWDTFEKYEDGYDWSESDEALFVQILEKAPYSEWIHNLVERLSTEKSLVIASIILAQHHLSQLDFDSAKQKIEPLLKKEALSPNATQKLVEILPDLALIPSLDINWETLENKLLMQPEQIPKLISLFTKGRNYVEAINLYKRGLEIPISMDEVHHSIFICYFRTHQWLESIQISALISKKRNLSELQLHRTLQAATIVFDFPIMLTSTNKLVELGKLTNSELKKIHHSIDKKANEKQSKEFEHLFATDSKLNFIYQLHKKASLGQYAACVDEIDEQLSLNDQDVFSLHLKAGIQSELGDFPSAITTFGEILKIDSQDSRAIEGRIQAGLKFWQPSLLEEEIKNALDAISSVKISRMYVNFLLGYKKDYASCLDFINTNAESLPGRFFREKKILCLLKEGEITQATELCRSHIVKTANSREGWALLAQIKRESQSIKEQLDCINNLLEYEGLSPIRTASKEGLMTPCCLQSDTETSSKDFGLVSVVMTTYKYDESLLAAIHSILNQTYPSLELIIVDDCSPDDTMEHLALVKQLDSRVKIIQMATNGGTYLAKNRGMTEAKGDYIAFMDSDDYSHPQRIEMALSKLSGNVELCAITQDHIRIDESSNIEFRGIGAIRMAAISLVIKTSVVDSIGFFDSLRVGADSEYIKRISLFFGEDSIHHQPLTTLFVTLHSTSLSGGGRFMIGWRSLTGPRLANHIAYSIWHKQNKNNLANLYVPAKVSKRAYAVPKELHAGPQWQSGMQVFSEHIHSRHMRWWKDKKELPQKHLSAKIKGMNFAKENGVKVPEVYWEGSDYQKIPPFDQLPISFVIKTERGWSSKNIFCMKEGINLLDQTAYTRDTILDSLANINQVSKTKTIVEELLIPEEASSPNLIPRCFKFYTFGDQIALVHVTLRTSNVSLSENTHHYFDEKFQPFSEKIMDSREVQDTTIQRPDCWDEMIQSVKKLGAALNVFMRIDMYATSKGAVFGDFTPTPHGGNGYSQFAERYLGSHWNDKEGVQ